MYRNSERFLTAFNRIEKKLRAINKNGRNLGFSKMVRILKQMNATVAEVLNYETNDNYRFIAGDTTVLEALLITDNGNRTEKLTGIITKLDIIGMQQPQLENI